MANAVKYTWVGVLGFTLLIALINMIISAILVRSYNNNGYPSTHIQTVTRYTLFVSCWNIFIGGAYVVFNFLLPTSIIASVASNLGYTFITWIFWLGAAASAETAQGGAFSCSNPNFAHCNQLRAMEAFSWINFIFYFFAFVALAFIGWRSSRSGNGGYMGPVAPSA